ncbi:heptaprenylglyceryl phosphate synthase [Peribacillus cavernae]|uniref:Heptaprenylglyceryl phosphate synthase n=1 Tax=Peribacillus cavernae TaxID=1674310 RepID=A0A3S0VVV6_9BACI|nr:heptaprenylglyceryl phosphate synthase [Peribacillus cavernae]MDQ0219834.1 putative glycerol-1-phosphate prenyltransferase [Peribacillus cavernae]RUQ27225.1 heptaprenylglyceryl phosphate synthase [Peribacillus cavernae]
MYDFREWKHAFKLDPNKDITDEALERICESGTDAIIVGGSDGITLENVLGLMARVRRFSVPCIMEISSLETVTPGFDLYFIPTVLNSTDPDWMMNLHHQAVKEYGEIINWDEMIVEGYCIMNPDCKAAALTKANTALDEGDVMAYAIMAEKMFHLPIFYLEYSGTYGDPRLVEMVKENLSETVLFYGGGIKTAEKAKEMGQFADVIVVGNIVYDDLAMALKTVSAVK